MTTNPKPRWPVLGALIACALVSIFLLGSFLPNGSLVQSTLSSLEEKKEDALELTAASTAVSVAITVIPGDTATPIAEKIADLSTAFLVVLCAIWLETYLVSVAGLLAFRILIPVGLLMIAIWLFFPRRKWLAVGARLIALGLLLFLMIPLSVKSADLIRHRYEEAVSGALSSAEAAAQDLTGASRESDEGGDPDADSASDEDSAVSKDTDSRTSTQGQSLLERILSFGSQVKETASDTISDAVSGITSLPASLSANLQEMLNQFMEAVAAMIITSCVIPILVLLLFIWVIKMLFASPKNTSEDTN